MTVPTEKILRDLADGVLNMDEDLTRETAEKALASGIEAYRAINDGLIPGMNEAGRLFEEQEYFVPELLLCSDALYAGLEVLTPRLPKGGSSAKARVIIGVVEGDTHDIGKNLVKTMLEAADFEVYDLGRNVPPSEFVAKAREVGANLICLSTLMTTTMKGMSQVIELLTQEGIRDQVKVLVGGGPISPAFARSIGADGCGDNAGSAVRVARQVLGLEQNIGQSVA